MKSATRTRSTRPGVLGVLLFVAVLSACEASSCDLGSFPDNPFPNLFPEILFPEIRCADDAHSGPIPTETTLPPGSEPLSGDVTIRTGSRTPQSAIGPVSPPVTL